MKQTIVCCAVLCLVVLALAGCASSSTQGPMAWLDEPLDGAALPLEPTEILAHASDADGVASIEFLINDVPLARAPTDGGVLAEATVGWDPQEPGTYTVRARGTDSQGNVGAEAVSVVTVGRVEGSPTPLPTGRPTEEIVTQETPSPRPPSSPVPGETPRPLTPTPRQPTATPIPPTRTPLPPTATPQPPARRAEIAYFEANPSTINAGGCSTLSWGVDYAAAVYLDGEGVGDHDTRQVCPPTTTTYTLYATSAGGDDQETATVTVIQAPTPTTILDTTAPTIRPFWADPDSITANGCGCTGGQTTVSAIVSDPSGVAKVEAYWDFGGGVGTGGSDAAMNPQGGDLYRIVLGPFDDTGQLWIRVQAWDTLDNNTSTLWGELFVTVHCIC